MVALRDRAAQHREAVALQHRQRVGQREPGHPEPPARVADDDDRSLPEPRTDEADGEPADEEPEPCRPRRAAPHEPHVHEDRDHPDDPGDPQAHELERREQQERSEDLEPEHRVSEPFEQPRKPEQEPAHRPLHLHDVQRVRDRGAGGREVIEDSSPDTNADWQSPALGPIHLRSKVPINSARSRMC